MAVRTASKTELRAKSYSRFREIGFSAAVESTATFCLEFYSRLYPEISQKQLRKNENSIFFNSMLVTEQHAAKHAYAVRTDISYFCGSIWPSFGNVNLNVGETFICYFKSETRHQLSLTLLDINLSLKKHSINFESTILHLRFDYQFFNSIILQFIV